MKTKKEMKEMLGFIIAHQDADGLLTSSLLLKFNPNSKIFFVSPYNLKKLILNLLLRLNNKAEKTNLWIIDLFPSQKNVLLASLFKRVIWLDHHESQKLELKPRNVKIFTKRLASCFAVVKEFLERKNEILKTKVEVRKLLEIANEIDTNQVKNKEAENLRSYLGWLKWKYKGIVLKLEMQSLAKLIAKADLKLNFLETIEAKEKIDEYEKYLKEKYEEIKEKIRIESFNGFKIAYLFLHESFPVYYLFNKLREKEIDLLIFGIKSENKLKFELRSFNEFNTLLIAKQFNGGGHKKASGGLAFMNESEFLVKIKNILKIFRK